MTFMNIIGITAAVLLLIILIGIGVDVVKTLMIGRNRADSRLRHLKRKR